MSRRRPLHPDTTDDELTEEVGPAAVSPVAPVKCEVPYNPLAWLAIPFHLSVSIFYALLILHGDDVLSKGKHIIDPEGKIPAFGGRFKYLSHINVCVQLVFFAAQLLTDLSPTFFRRSLQRFTDFIFTGIAFPLATLVVVLFWGLYLIDRELVFPVVLDKVVPVYLNHFWHSFVLLWCVCEMYLFHHRFPSTQMAAINAFLIGFGYISWIMYIYSQTNWWAYPILNVLPPYAMALFFGSGMFACLGFFFLGRWLMYMIWGVVTYFD